MNILLVHAKPASSRDGVDRVSPDEYVVRTTQPPIAGRANRAIIALLAAHLGISVSDLAIVSGRTSRTKRISVL